MSHHVTAFTDTYLPTVNGVTYTIDLWRSRWNDGYGRMRVVYPRSTDYEPQPTEIPVPSVPAPTFRGHRLGLPVWPSTDSTLLTDPSPFESTDIVHVHSPFTLGIAGLRFADRIDAPVVASYHTVLGERIEQRFERPAIASGVQRVCQRHERRFYDAADLVTTPTADARRYLRREIDPETEIVVVSNGIDTDTFRPVDPTRFVDAHGLDVDLDDDRPVVGYTGRHSPEKYLDELLEATAGLDVRVLLGGDGPSRSRLEDLARSLGCDATFLGFLPREDVPALYSLLDCFVFPGRAETQGLVALEANACGTPVIGADAGALRQTVLDGETGYHYPPGDVEALRDVLEETLAERDRLRELCLGRREMIGIERTLDRLASLYDRAIAAR